MHEVLVKRSSAVAIIKLCLVIGRGTERFELPASSEARVRRALVFAARGAEAREEAEAVLRLLVALESRLRSPSAAERLRAWMRATPELCDVIRALGSARTKGLDLVRDFLRGEGRSAEVAAPLFGAAVPRGALPLRELLNPPAARAAARPAQTSGRRGNRRRSRVR